MSSVYPHYDIVIWSQTHWRWLESKLVELGIIGGDSNYKICFVADSLPMFSVRFVLGNPATTSWDMTDDRSLPYAPILKSSTSTRSSHSNTFGNRIRSGEYRL